MKNTILFFLFLAFVFSNLDQKVQATPLIQKDVLDTSFHNIDIITLKPNDSLLISNTNKDSMNLLNKEFFKNLSVNQIQVNDLFYEQLIECKLIFADAITYDISLDTIETEIQFHSLFESFEFLDSLSLDDEYQRIEYNMLLNASIDYYQNKSVTVNKLESPLSMALFKEKLEAYFYKQQLEDIEFVDETVEFIDGHIPITFNNKVSRNVKYFSSPDAKKGVQLWLNKIEKFKKIVLPILEEEGVPPEIFYLSVIESGLNPLALSYAQASGPWQFISSTGKIYGLNKTWYVDERRDFEKSTYAAARYLKDLKEIFDKKNPIDDSGENWYLAFAAYNCGASRVLKEMKRSNSNNFWDLSRLPGQTRNYIPKILAIFLISKNPEKYGFTINSVPDMDWINKEINKQATFDQLSKISNVSIKTLQEYNPEIKNGIIPPLKNGDVYTLRLPNNSYDSFDSLFLLLQNQKTDDLLIIDYVVKRGDNLSRIAKKYNVRIHDITSMNNINSSKFIQPGQTLRIPTQGYDEYMQLLLSSNKTKKIYYKVKGGDSLGEIAEKFRTSVKKIKAWNGIREKSDMIYIGKKLILHVPSNQDIDETVYGRNNSRKVIYKVRRGDSLSEISQKYKIKIKELKNWNNLQSDTIAIGQKLIIYRKY